MWVERRVSTDHVVSIASVLYEMPRGYAGRKVRLQRRLLDGTLGFIHEGKVVVLQPVDRRANAHAPRGRGKKEEEPARPMPPQTAAETAFRRDFDPLVDADGGFSSTSFDDE